MSSNSAKVVLGVLTGVAIGTVLGVLFAPDKGSETRKKVVEKGGDMVDDVNEKLKKLIDELNRKIDEAKTKTTGEKADINETVVE
ncbi:MAG TPA: YtxH domain-containing protein [Prolixibacteraceae bacterium]|nr:YtxH domain-containing protein [Prolixibacteraceae bacterium]HPS12038.1 YtxH domain-containing protein [Prolixibacteraceae bacterium]